MATATPSYPGEPNMILTCDDQVFQLHSHVVGEQSEYLAKALASMDKDAAICKIKIDRHSDIEADCGTVARVIYYLYHGDYGFATEYASHPATPSDADAKAQESGSAPVQEDEERGIRSGSLALKDALVAHVQIHAAAKEFGIPDLTTLSKNRFTSRLDLYPLHSSGFADFIPAVVEVYRNADRCNMNDLKTILIAACLRDADRLQHDYDLSLFIVRLSGIDDDDDCFPSFARDFLRDALEALVTARQRIVFLEGVLASKKKVEEWIGGVKRGTPEANGS